MIRNKQLLCLCFALIFSVEVYGQKKKNVIIAGMPERTFLINKWDKENRPLLRKTPSYSTSPSITIRQQLRNRWYLNYGISYSYQAQHYEIAFGADGPGHKDRTILSYMKFPLLIQYNFINRDNFSFFLQAGPQVGFLFVEEGAIINVKDIIEVGGAYKPIVFEGVLSSGIEIKLGKNIYYNLQLRFDHSFNNVTKLSYEDVSVNGAVKIHDVYGRPRSKEYNMTIGLLNGISIKIK